MLRRSSLGSSQSRSSDRAGSMGTEPRDRLNPELENGRPLSGHGHPFVSINIGVYRSSGGARMCFPQDMGTEVNNYRLRIRVIVFRVKQSSLPTGVRAQYDTTET